MTELDDYKLRVRTVAKVLAKQHGWCTVVDEALAEIDADGAIDIDLDALVEGAEGEAWDRGHEAGWSEFPRPQETTLAQFERTLTDLQQAVDPFYTHTEKPAELVARLASLYDKLATEADLERVTGR